MSKSQIPPKIKTQLWTLSGGRCEYMNCNKPLWRNDLTLLKMNKAYIAHIVSDSEDGPRGDKIRSLQLAQDFDNLMLLCDEHHRLIDVEDVSGHPEELLVKMKKGHELRIEHLTSLLPDKRSHIVLFGTNIGLRKSTLNFNQIIQAILPERFPKNSYSIDLDIKNSSFYDNETLYWNYETENLVRQFKEKIDPLIISDTVKHFSLFGLAPQPLLIKLGTLFSDLIEVSVYQMHREPNTWEWQKEDDFDDFIIEDPLNYNGIPVLKLSLSASITNDRIENLFSEKVNIWSITHNNPNNDFLKTKTILSKFRKICRKFFNIAKEKHGQNSHLHVFPAMPVSASIEFGRVWMPKADMRLIIYDQNIKNKGFFKTIEI